MPSTQMSAPESEGSFFEEFSFFKKNLFIYLFLAIAASLVAEHRLQTRRLSSCGSRAWA